MLQGVTANVAGDLKELLGQMWSLDRWQQKRCWDRLVEFLLRVEAVLETEAP